MLASNITTVDTRYGRMSFFADDVYIGRSLALYGEYSEGETALWRKLIKAGDVVIDVGANIGALSLALAALVGPKGMVLAFEAHPETCELLQRNIDQNDLFPRVIVYDNALGRLPGQTTMPSLAALAFKNYGGIATGSGSIQVVSYTLDECVEDETISFIKIDVEGAESDVILGGRDLISRCRPLLYVEDHPGLGGGKELHQLLRSLNYRLFEHRPPLYSPDNMRGDRVNVFGNVVSFNVLAVPTEKVEQFRHATDDLTPIVAASPRAGKTGWAGIARFGGVGDNLIAAAGCRALHEAGYKVEVISQAPQAELFENNPFVEKLSIYDKGDLPSDANAWLAWFNLRAKEYTKFVNLSHTIESRHAAFPSMSSFWWPAHYRRKVFAGSYIETVFELLDLPPSLGPLFFPTEEEKQQALTTRRAIGDGPIIGWCMAGTRIDKIYPQTPMVIARLIKELGAQVAMLAAPPPYRDFELCKQAMEMVTAQNGSCNGLHHAGSPSMDNQTWPIRRILTFAMNCDLMIGPDTGPMWGVAFEPLPKILLHSHASVENITKHWVNTVSLHADPAAVKCAPCHRLHDDSSTCVPNQWGNGAACISDIGVDLVLMAARAALAGALDDFSSSSRVTLRRGQINRDHG